MIESGLISFSLTIFGLQILLIPFQVIHYFSRKLDKSRLRFLALSLTFLLFNSCWLAHLYFMDTYGVFTENLVVFTGIGLTGMLYFYFLKELNIEKGKYTIRRLLFGLIGIELLRETIQTTLGALPTWASLLFACLFQTVVAFYVIHTIQRIYHEQKNNPIVLASIGTLLLALILPLLLFFVRIQYIENFVINLGFVFLVIAYFKHYFAQMNIENSIYRVNLNYSEMNLKERYLHFPHELNDFDLTLRQREVGLLLLEGKSYQEIADIFSVEEGTVRSHAMQVYKKTGIIGSKKADRFREKFNGSTITGN